VKEGQDGWAAIVAVLGLSLLQRFDLLGQAHDLFLHLQHQSRPLFQQAFQLLDSCIPLRQLLTQGLVLFSQMLTFFFELHTRTLLDFSTLDKSLPTWAVTLFLFCCLKRLSDSTAKRFAGIL
jgi:hypothetical protein